MDREVGKILDEFREEELQSKYILWEKKSVSMKKEQFTICNDIILCLLFIAFRIIKKYHSFLLGAECYHKF